MWSDFYIPIFYVAIASFWKSEKKKKMKIRAKHLTATNASKQFQIKIFQLKKNIHLRGKMITSDMVCSMHVDFTLYKTSQQQQNSTTTNHCFCNVIYAHRKSAWANGASINLRMLKSTISLSRSFDLFWSLYVYVCTCWSR